VVKATDTGKYYYIGGISSNWATGKIIVYRGNNKASSAVKLNRAILDKFMENNIAIIPLDMPREPKVWINSPSTVKELAAYFGTTYHSFKLAS